MPQYLIIAYDFTDAEALNRRMAHRPSHLEGARKLKDSQNFIVGGAILNDEGKMMGSTMIVQFEDEAALKQWMESEPYINGKVWDKIEIRPFRVADV